MPPELSFNGFFLLLQQRWKTFLLVGLAAIVLSAIFSGPTFITPKFRSGAIVYPVNLNPYSVETRTDQLLQLLESNAIRDSLLRKFDLMHHWEQDTARPSGRAYLYMEYSDRVEVSKTRYESVQIEVTDEDPVLARDMVGEMLHQLDLLARRLQREKSREVLAIAERAMREEKQKLDSAESRLRQLRENGGLLVYEAQTQELTRGYMRLLEKGAGQAQRDEVKRMMEELERNGGEFRSLTDMADMLRINYDRLRSEHDRVRIDVEKELSYTNTVVAPEISDKKVWPVRWLVVLIATASALFLAFVLIAWTQNRR